MKLLAVFLALSFVSLAASQSVETPPSAPGLANPNLQTTGFQAGLTGAKLKANPLGLVPAPVQREGLEPPNAGITFSSQQFADVSSDKLTMWSWEANIYNTEFVGLTTLHNIKDPKWPEIYRFFETTNSSDFYPIAYGEININELNAMAQAMTDGTKSLGYKTIDDAVNASALGAVLRMASDPTQGIFGVFGNDDADSDLTGGAEMPVDETTLEPVDEILAELGAPPNPEEASAAGAPPKSAAPLARQMPACLLAALVLCAAMLL